MPLCPDGPGGSPEAQEVLFLFVLRRDGPPPAISPRLPTVHRRPSMFNRRPVAGCWPLSRGASDPRAVTWHSGSLGPLKGGGINCGLPRQSDTTCFLGGLSVVDRHAPDQDRRPQPSLVSHSAARAYRRYPVPGHVPCFPDSGLNCFPDFLTQSQPHCPLIP